MTQRVSRGDTRILAVDVCGTLFHANTSAGLAAYHHERVGNRWRARFISLISSRKLPFSYLCTVTAKMAAFDLHRYATLMSLKGEQKASLGASAKCYLEVLDGVRIKKVHQLVQDMRDQGWTPVLTSNSLSAIIEPIATQLGVAFVASELGWQGTLCTGRLSVDLTARKRFHLERFLGLELNRSNFSVITDNQSDNDLIDAAGIAVLVAHGEPKSWMINKNAEILRV